MFTKTRTNLTSKLLQLRSLTSGNSGGGILFTSRNSAGGGLLSSQSVNRQLSPATLPLFNTSGRCFSSGSSHPPIRPMHWGFQIVPQGSAAVVERFGKYAKTLDSGFHLLIPFVDEIKHVHSLTLKPIRIPYHSAITKDNDHIHVEGILFAQIVDPKLASYGVEDPICSVIQLAKRTVGIELRKLTFHEIITQRILLEEKLLKSINEVAKDWGLQCLYYDIRDISMPDEVKVMAVAKLKRSLQNLDNEGHAKASKGDAKAQAQEDAKSKEMQAVAKGKKRVQNLDSEGNAKTIRKRAQVEEVANATVHKAPDAEGGIEAASLMAAEKQAFSEPAEKGLNGHC